MIPLEDVLFVPVHATSVSGVLRIFTARRPDGDPVGLAFRSGSLLDDVMGVDQPRTQLHIRALRDMLRPLGITAIQVDPARVAVTSPSLQVA